MTVQVGIRELRDNLRSYLARVKLGEDVLVTERGKVVARITPLDRPSKRDELIARGIITPARIPWSSDLIGEPVPVSSPLSEEVSRQRGPDV